MHNTAYNNAQKFYDKYCKDNIENKRILDIGSMDFNGSLKPIFNKGYYIGLDQSIGPNVDIVASAHKIPLQSDSVDIITCSSCFEHDNMFWVTFLELCRVVKPDGFVYINAPSNGPYHAYPVDNWRFYLDSWKALEQWGNHNNYNMSLVESYIDPIRSACGNWNDSVGIFKKLK